MATRIAHGDDPRCDFPVTGEFSCRVVGYYTPFPTDGAGGVREVKFQSDRPVKRVAEMLVLRTVFRNWYEQTMRELGQEPKDGYAL